MLNQTVLLVEDSPTDILLIQRAVAQANLACQLAIVRDGDAAIDYLSGVGPYADRQQHPLPVLVLLDLKLPRRSGHEVLEWCRQQAGLRRLPVAVLTSSNHMGDVNRAYDLGANSYLVKPVASGAMLDLVKLLGLYWLVANEKPELRP
jgi:CheY-like chemotaxis protein